jgi:sigma-E factor negative regulatory protein RseB
VGPASPGQSIPARTDRLPPGFLFAGHAEDPDHPGSEHLVFSDGLASVSVYVEPDAPEAGIPEGLSRMGLTNAWSMRQSSRRITAVGEVPPITLKEFGQAFLETPTAD